MILPPCAHCGRIFRGEDALLVESAFKAHVPCVSALGGTDLQETRPRHRRSRRGRVTSLVCQPGRRSEKGAPRVVRALQPSAPHSPSCSLSRPPGSLRATAPTVSERPPAPDGRCPLRNTN